MEKDNPDVLASAVSVQCPGLSKLLMTVLFLCAAVCCQDLVLWLEFLVPPGEDKLLPRGLGTILFSGVPVGLSQRWRAGGEGSAGLGTEHASPPRRWLSAFYLQPFHCNLLARRCYC